MTASHPEATTDRRKGSGSWVLVQLFFMAAYGAGLTIFVFGIIPYLQIVTGGAKKDMIVRTVAAVTAPPPPDSLLDEPPPPPDAPEEPPPEMQAPPDLGPASLDLGGPVGGGGAAMPSNFGSGAMANAMANFSLGEMGQKPRPVHQVQPRIPANLRSAAGRIEVEFVVDVQGRVQSPRVTSTFNAALNEPVLTAIKQWRFEPGQRGGKRVPYKTKMPFKFGR
jgi:protein TonB